MPGRRRAIRGARGIVAARGAATLLAGTLLAGTLVPACVAAHERGADAGADTDPRARCGLAVCGPGELCCDPACGLCAADPTACASVFCPDPCPPMRARGEGDCGTVLGYRWSGSGCEPVAGCACAGDDCTALFNSEWRCLEAFPACRGELCDGFPEGGCGPARYCNRSGPWRHGFCYPRPTSCAESSPFPVCASSLATYPSVCAANAAGHDALSLGGCDASFTHGRARTCDGLRWDFTFTAVDEGCNVPFDSFVNFVLDPDMVSDLGRAQAVNVLLSWHGRPYTYAGEVTVHSFVAGSESRVSLRDGLDPATSTLVLDDVPVRTFCPPPESCGSP